MGTFEGTRRFQPLKNGVIIRIMAISWIEASLW